MGRGVPLERLNRNIHSSSARLVAIARNYQYLEIEFKKRTLKKLNKIFKNDFCFVNCYMKFSLNILDRLTICHSLILAGYVCKFTQRKQRKTIILMLSLLRLYQDHMKRGLVRVRGNIKSIFLLLETIEIATNLSNNKHFAELNILNEMSSDLGSSLRYLQFGNGNLISAHGGCLGIIINMSNYLHQ